MKHHYMPVFFLKQWMGDDERLCQYRRWGTKVAVNRKHPDGTGYVEDLYAIDGAPPSIAHEFETIFMHGIDTAASEALEKLVSGDPTPWNARLRSAWVRFIVSFMYRNPGTIGLLKNHMRAVFAAAVEKARAEYPAIRREGDPLTFEEAEKEIRAEGPYLSALMLVKNTVESKRIGETIFKMNWSVVRLGRSPLTLLVSDRPVDRPLGFDSPDAYIAFPIGPGALFVAEHGDRWTKELGHRDPTAVIKAMNEATVQRGREFVWGIDDSQRRFVQNRLGRSPDVPVITDAQRQRAIDAILAAGPETSVDPEALAEFEATIRPEQLFKT